MVGYEYEYASGNKFYEVSHISEIIWRLAHLYRWDEVFYKRKCLRYNQHFTYLTIYDDAKFIVKWVILFTEKNSNRIAIKVFYKYTIKKFLSKIQFSIISLIRTVSDWVFISGSVMSI